MKLQPIALSTLAQGAIPLLVGSLLVQVPAAQGFAPDEIHFGGSLTTNNSRS